MKSRSATFIFRKKIVKCLTKHWNEGGSDNVTTAIYQKYRLLLGEEASDFSALEQGSVKKDFGGIH